MCQCTYHTHIDVMCAMHNVLGEGGGGGGGEESRGSVHT